MPRNKIRYLCAEEVKTLLTMEEAIAAMAEAFVQLSNKQVEVPLRMHLNVPQHRGTVLIKPVYLPKNERIGLKVISLFRNNPTKGLPFSYSLMLVVEAETGIPLAVMDGNSLTAIRTGAASGLATDLFARKDSTVAAIFGAGRQGRTQLEAVCTVRSIKQALIFDPDPGQAKRFAAEMSSTLGIPVNIPRHTAELHEADIICAATTASQPVFEAHHVKPGAHINAVGAFQPDYREIPPETVQAAKLIVDQREACLQEAGDILIPLKEGLITENHIFAEIGEVAAGQKKGRESGEEITLFKSVGNAVQDIAAANRVLRLAEQKGVGTELEL